METRVTKIFPCTAVVTNVDMETFAASGTNGTVAIVNEKWNGLGAAVASVTEDQLFNNPEKLYVVLKTAESLYTSDPIQTKNIKNRKYADAAAVASQITDIDPGSYAPVVGQTYILRVLYKHRKDTFGLRIPDEFFYSVTATSTSMATLSTAFAAQINADDHIRRAITASVVSTDHLRLTGQDEEVRFTAVMTTRTSSLVPEVEVGDEVLSQAPSTGSGYYLKVKAIESYDKAYYGLDNRRGYPVDTFTSNVASSGYYDMLTIEHDNINHTTDVAKGSQLWPITTIIAIANADAGTPHASYTALKEFFYS